MASITFDGQSFMLDGRRVWLVSGGVHYARVSRAHWADRIHAAKQAGLNCIETPVIWARHEPRHGQFDFKGENDLRHFVQLVHQAGMWCILRPGPFVDSGWDLGGLPPWLLINENVKLRTHNQAFLESCSRYITALAGQLRDLQVNSPTPKNAASGSHGGPIIMLQNEHAWTCGDESLAESYLGELDRYFREAGFNVPIINSNDLWQSVEGQIDGWTGFDGLLSHLRQLGVIRPAQPRVVIDFRDGHRKAWGQDVPEVPAPGVVLRRLAEVLAAGGQFNISPFHAGTNFAFSAGRDPTLGADGFLCTSPDLGAPLNEVGLPGPSYSAVRRICTFASRFSRVLSHLDPARQPVTLLPESPRTGKNKSNAARVAVVHAVGSQGGVAFVFGDDSGNNQREAMSLLLADGSTLPVDLGAQSVVWCLLDTRLSGRANLDYCNLSAFAIVGRVFVCFGAAGTRAMLSINGAPFETTVPEGKMPSITEHEGVTLVIANEKQIDDISVDDTGVYVGVAGIDRHAKPIAHPDYKQYTRIDSDGKAIVHKPMTAPGSGAEPKARVHKPSLGEWELVDSAEHTRGESARFAIINKPADLVSLGAPYGYGWYRVRFSVGSTGKLNLYFPQAAHRLHAWLDSEPVGIIGSGPGATGLLLPISVKRGTHTLVVLAENLGRSSSGADLGEPTGLYGHAWEVEAIKPGKPKLVSSDPVDILEFRSPLWRVHRDDVTDAQRLTWRFEHRRKSDIILEIAPFEVESDSAGSGGSGPAPIREREGGIVLLNNKPIHSFQQGGFRPLIIDQALLNKGNNDIQIAMIGSTEAAAPALEKAVHFYDCIDSPTIKGEWAFAKWEPPASEAFHKSGRHAPGPCWWRCAFDAGDGDAPLLLDCTGLTKGQLYVNGRHVGRYFVATATGKKVGPQTRCVIPRSFLSADGEDEMVIFDEHGHAPTRCKLLADASLTTSEE